MSQAYNVYCDESCHLEHDKQKAMVLGAIWCPKQYVRKFSNEIRQIKERHSIFINYEIKWTRVSPGGINFYSELIDYFFENPDLHFRAFIIPDKSKLDHKNFNQTHDTFYYKVYYNLIKVILDTSAIYEIYLDKKDTCSSHKVNKLREYLCNAMYDFDFKRIRHIQTIDSNESQIMQLADLLIGAVSYANRDLDSSPTKKHLIQKISNNTGYDLKRSTLLSEKKFNIFSWDAFEIF